MLQERYMPEFHFSERHSIAIASSRKDIYVCLLELDFADSWIIRLLFRLRGMPRTTHGLQGLQQMGFTLLESIPNEELILGLIGQFWKPHGNIQRFLKEDFATYGGDSFARATWNFRLEQKGAKILLETETRILCGKEALPKFRQYWSVIKPFSGIVRKEILKSVRKKAERSQYL